MNPQTTSDKFTLEKYHQLLPTHKSQYEKLKKECFNWESKLSLKQLVEHRDKFCSGKDSFLYIFATQNNRIIGQSVLLKREINYKGRKILLGGIGGVGVTKKKRRMGVATAILKKAMEELKRNQCEVAYLCCDTKNPNLVKQYGQVGFLPLERPHTYLGDSGKRYTDHDGMIAPVLSMEKFSQILEDEAPFDIGKGNW